MYSTSQQQLSEKYFGVKKDTLGLVYKQIFAGTNDINQANYMIYINCIISN